MSDEGKIIRGLSGTSGNPMQDLVRLIGYLETQEQAWRTVMLRFRCSLDTNEALIDGALILLDPSGTRLALGYPHSMHHPEQRIVFMNEKTKAVVLAWCRHGRQTWSEPEIAAMFVWAQEQLEQRRKNGGR